MSQGHGGHCVEVMDAGDHGVDLAFDVLVGVQVYLIQLFLVHCHLPVVSLKLVLH